MTKICSKCNIEKPKTDFYKEKRVNDGLKASCKKCHMKTSIETRDPEKCKINRAKHAEKHAEKLKQSAKEYKKKKVKENPDFYKEKYFKDHEKSKRIAKKSREKNRDKRLEYGKLYYQKNKEKIISDKRNYTKNNKEKISERRKIYNQNNKTKVRSYVNNKMKTDPLFRLSARLRCRMHKAFTRGGSQKSKTTIDILGVTFDVVKKHIESKFSKGMSWDNYGQGEGKWEVDHVIPLSSAKTEEELITLCHYRNLQPLWSKENKQKSDSIIETQLSIAI